MLFWSLRWYMPGRGWIDFIEFDLKAQPLGPTRPRPRGRLSLSTTESDPREPAEPVGEPAEPPPPPARKLKSFP